MNRFSLIHFFHHNFKNLLKIQFNFPFHSQWQNQKTSIKSRIFIASDCSKLKSFIFSPVQQFIFKTFCWTLQESTDHDDNVSDHQLKLSVDLFHELLLFFSIHQHHKLKSWEGKFCFIMQREFVMKPFFDPKWRNENDTEFRAQALTQI